MTPEQEEQVRRALAAVGDASPGAARPPGDGAEPMPPDVAARLDGVLADLVAQRAVDTPSGEDTGPLPHPDAGVAAVEAVERRAPDATDAADELARLRRGRRGRWQQAGLAAAAACVAALVGAAVATGGLGRGDSTSTTASSQSDSGGVTAGEGPVGQPEAAPAPRRPSSSPRDAPRAASGDTSVRRTTAAPVARLRTPGLTAGVQRLVDSGPLRPVAPRSPGPSCDVPLLRSGERVLVVLLDGRPASLVLGAPVAGRRTAQVFGCRDATAPLASVVVRASVR